MSKHRGRRPQRTTESFGRGAIGTSSIRPVRVILFNFGTQFRPIQTRDTVFLPLPAPRVDRTRADDSEQISPPPITRHTVYEKTRNLKRNHFCQWGIHSYQVGPLSRLVRRPPFEPSLPKGVLPLIIAANGPNGAISLTQTFNRNLFHVCNGQCFGVQKAKNEDRGTIVFTVVLKKNLNTSRPSEYPPVRGKSISKRFGGIIGCKNKTSSWHLIGFHDGSYIGSTVSCQGETHRINLKSITSTWSITRKTL